MDDLRPILERARRAVPDRPGDLDDLSRRRDRRGRSRRVVAAVTALALVAGVGLGGWTVLRDRNGGAVDPPARPWKREVAGGCVAAHHPRGGRGRPGGGRRGESAVPVADPGGPGGREVRDHRSPVARARHLLRPGNRGSRRPHGIPGLHLVVRHHGRGGLRGRGRPVDKEEALLSMERLVREDRSGMWTIASVAGPIPLSNRAAFFYGGSRSAPQTGVPSTRRRPRTRTGCARRPTT